MQKKSWSHMIPKFELLLRYNLDPDNVLENIIYMRPYTR